MNLWGECKYHSNLCTTVPYIILWKNYADIYLLTRFRSPINRPYRTTKLARFRSPIYKRDACMCTHGGECSTCYLWLQSGYWTGNRTRISGLLVRVIENLASSLYTTPVLRPSALRVSFPYPNLHPLEFLHPNKCRTG